MAVASVRGGNKTWQAYIISMVTLLYAIFVGGRGLIAANCSRLLGR